MAKSKDPAVLFYHRDFRDGVRFMSLPAIGAYMMVLCEQCDRGADGVVPLDVIMHYCKNDESLFKEMSNKLNKEGEGYYNKRMREELINRRKFTDSRRKNRLGSKKKYKPKKEEVNNTSYSSDKLVANANANKNINKGVGEKIEYTDLTDLAKKVYMRDQIYFEQNIGALKKLTKAQLFASVKDFCAVLIEGDKVEKAVYSDNLKEFHSYYSNWLRKNIDNYKNKDSKTLTNPFAIG